MAKLGISTGTTPDDGTGDSLLDGAVKINSNFDEIYTFFGDGTNLTGAGVTYITAGSGISVDQNTGNVTITATGGGGGGETYWAQNATGINTTSNVGIGTTTASSALTVQGDISISGIATISGDGTNAYLRYGSSNAYTNFVTTYGVSQVGGVSLISADANGAALSENTTLNAAYWRIRTLSTGAEVNGDLTISGPTGGGLNVTGVSTLGAGVTVTGTTFTNQLSVSGFTTYSQFKSETPGGKYVAFDDAAGGLYLSDDTGVYLGEGYDLQLEHIAVGAAADRNRILSINGNLDLETIAGSISIKKYSGGEFIASFTVDAGVDLYYDNVKKFETLGAGVTVTGTTFTDQLSVSGVSTLAIGGAGNPEAVYFQSTTEPQASLKISQATGNDYGVLMTFTSSSGNEATIETDSNSNLIVSTDGTLNLRANGSDTLLQGQTSCDLYYSNVKKFETLGAGVTVTGTTFTDQLSVSGVSTFGAQVNVNTGGISKLNIGAPNDLYLQWDESSQSASLETSATGNLYVQNGANGGIFLNAGISNQAGVHLYPSDRVELRHAASKKFETTTNGVSISGIITAVSGIVTYYGDTSNAVDGRWTLTGDGSNYTLSGIGITSGNNTDPILYFARGRVYEFVNTQPVSHPFVIRDSDGGTDWTAGITTSTDGTNDYLRFEVPMNAPNTLYYQCTVHSGMGNTISVYPNLFT